MSQGRQTTPDGPVVWVKEKYTSPKQNGRYKGGTNAAAKKSDRKRKKVGGGPGPIEHVLVLGSRATNESGQPLSLNGRRWETRPRTKR